MFFLNLSRLSAIRLNHRLFWNIKNQNKQTTIQSFHSNVTQNQENKSAINVSGVQFYYKPESPPCRAVEMTANMIGVTLNKHYVDLFKGEHRKTEYIALNPRHKVPYIVDGNLKLGESRAIMAYLVNKYKENDPLYPRDPEKRAQIDEMLYYDNGVLSVASSRLYFPVLFGLRKDFDPEAFKYFRRKVEYIEHRLGESDSEFMFGDHLTIADISLRATFSLPEAFDYDLSVHKHLLAYLKRSKMAIPDYDKINDEATEGMRYIIKSRKGE